jgi:hypothetical protein
VEKSKSRLFHLAWKSRKKRGIPTFHTASTAAGYSFLNGLTGSGPNRRNWLPLSPALTAVGPGNMQFSAEGNFSVGSSENLTSPVAWKSSSVGVRTINRNSLATAADTGSTITQHGRSNRPNHPGSSITRIIPRHSLRSVFRSRECSSSLCFRPSGFLGCDDRLTSVSRKISLSLTPRQLTPA